MNKIKSIIFAAIAIVGIGLVATPALVYASPADEIKNGVDKVGGNDDQPKLEEGIKTIVNVLLFVLGAIAVIMIIIGGIRYSTSNGDSSQITGAKNTILYAVIGLIVAILAYAIVNFVLDAFTK